MVECLCNQIGHHAGIFATFGNGPGQDQGGGQFAQACGEGRDGIGSGGGFQHFQAVEAHAEVIAERRFRRVAGVERVDVGGVTGLNRRSASSSACASRGARRARPEAGWRPTESRTAMSTMALAFRRSGVTDQCRHDGLRVGDDGEVGALDHFGVKIGVDGDDVLYLVMPCKCWGAPAIPSAK